MWGRVIATFCEVLATMNPSLADFRITMDNLNRMCSRHDLPELRQQLRITPSHAAPPTNVSVLLRLLRMSPSLQQTAMVHKQALAIGRAMAAERRAHVHRAACPAAKPPLRRAKPQGSMLHIVWRCGLYGGKVLRTGAIWGEDMLLSSEALRSKKVAKALTYLEVYIICSSSSLLARRQVPDSTQGSAGTSLRR